MHFCTPALLTGVLPQMLRPVAKPSSNKNLNILYHRHELNQSSSGLSNIIEHHVIPMVPYHTLPKLHQAIVAQTPPPYTSLWQVYKELIPALIKQAYENPDYHIDRPLPA